MRGVVMLLLVFFLLSAGSAAAGGLVDTVPPVTNPKKNSPPDTTVKKTPHSPKIALRRSAMVPGLGQAYNKQYWKIPIVYGGLGVTAGIFAYNVKWYKKCRFAYNAVATNNTADIAKIDPKLQGLGVTDLSFYRRQFRQSADYSVLFFLGFWGLNVLDAVVFAHLKDFDVSDDLTIQLKAGHNSFAQTSGVTLAFDLQKKRRPLPAAVK